MLHMQHAHVVAVLVRQHEAARLKAERDALAKARRKAAAGGASETAVGSSRPARKARVHGPRPA